MILFPFAFFKRKKELNEFMYGRKVHLCFGHYLRLGPLSCPRGGQVYSGFGKRQLANAI